MPNRVTKNDSWVQNPDGTPGYTANLITGCLLDHDYCFARELAHGRLKSLYLANWTVSPPDLIPHGMTYIAPSHNPFYPRFWPGRLVELDQWLASRREPVGVFLNIMGEWLGDWVPEPWQTSIMELVRRYPQHRIYMLTHFAKNLTKFSPFPDHCYVGVTVNADGDMTKALTRLAGIEAGVRFLSVEPMLGAITMKSHPLQGRADWIIVGAMTCGGGQLAKLHASHPQLTPMPWGRRYTLQPRLEWVEEVVGAADQAGIPVFLKDNLMPLISKVGNVKPCFTSIRENAPESHSVVLRQEVPCSK